MKYLKIIIVILIVGSTIFFLNKKHIKTEYTKNIFKRMTSSGITSGAMTGMIINTTYGIIPKGNTGVIISDSTNIGILKNNQQSIINEGTGIVVRTTTTAIGGPIFGGNSMQKYSSFSALSKSEQINYDCNLLKDGEDLRAVDRCQKLQAKSLKD